MIKNYNLNISLIELNINVLNTGIKKYRISVWIKKQVPTTC